VEADTCRVAHIYSGIYSFELAAAQILDKEAYNIDWQSLVGDNVHPRSIGLAAKALDKNKVKAFY
jgi:hypothetical protein